MAAANSTITLDHFVFVMKCKQGELEAIDAISDSRLVPLIEVTGSERATAIPRKWKRDDVIWVQPVNVSGIDDAAFATDTTAVFDTLRAAGTAAVPVALISETPDSAAAIAQIIATDKRGVVLRLEAEDLVVMRPADIQADIDAFLVNYGVSPADCDVVLDASLVRDGVAARVATVETAMTSLPYLSDWRNFVVALSAFPDAIGDQMGTSTTHAFPRSDRAAYMSVVSRGPARVPVYADFGVGQPTYADVPFAPIPNIKYTDVADWHVHRGAQRANPSPQYVQLATALAAATYFRGASFSRGDAYVTDVANGAVGPGNPTTYLRAAMTHHLAHVLDRLATHGEP